MSAGRVGLAPGRRTGLSTFAGVVALLVLLVVVPVGIVRWSYDVWGGLLLAPVLVLVTLPFLQRLADDPWEERLLVAALLAKMAGTVVRYAVIYEVYGAGDATGYHRWGQRLAPLFRQLNLDAALADWEIGTQALRTITGVLYAIIGTSMMGGFFAFSWLGFIGLLLLYRAHRRALPDTDHRIYGLLVFFLPSMMFWPSSIGKEAWLTFGVGVAANGFARVVTHGRGGFLLLCAGLYAIAIIRPHIALFLFVGLATGYLVPRAGRARALAPVARVVGVAVIIMIGSVIASQAEEFFGIEDLSASSLESVQEHTVDRSEAGSSTFEARPVGSPVDVPMAVITVLFRPFPFEARNIQALVTSVEGLFVLALVIGAARRLASPAMRRLVVRPYVVFASVYSLAFIVGFSSVSNFGIIARQRVLLLPMLFVLLCLRARSAPDEDPSRAPGPRARRPSRWRPAHVEPGDGEPVRG